MSKRKKKLWDCHRPNNCHCHCCERKLRDKQSDLELVLGIETSHIYIKSNNTYNICEKLSFSNLHRKDSHVCVWYLHHLCKKQKYINFCSLCSVGRYLDSAEFNEVYFVFSQIRLKTTRSNQHICPKYLSNLAGPLLLAVLWAGLLPRNRNDSFEHHLCIPRGAGKCSGPK